MTKHAIFSLLAAAALSLAAPSLAHAQEVPQMSQLPTPTESGFAEVNDVKIWYQTYGDGDPLILLHGGFGSVEMLVPTSRRLRRTERSLASTCRRMAAPDRWVDP